MHMKNSYKKRLYSRRFILNIFYINEMDKLTKRAVSELKRIRESGVTPAMLG